MFILVKVLDVVEVEPAYFSPELQPDRRQALRAAVDGSCYTPSLEDILWHRISERYVGKIIPNRGLCVAVAELLSFSNSVIRGSDGASWTTLTFNAVVFRPVINERIYAVIDRQTEQGIYLSVEFYKDIFVPAQFLIQPSAFDVTSGSWHLVIEDEESAGAPVRNEYKNGDRVMVGVWDVSVKGAVDQVGVVSAEGTGLSSSPMSITGTFADIGLGPCVWFE